MRTHEQVIAEIENRLLAGILKAGDRHLQNVNFFAEVFGGSRGAVREALRILEAIGASEAGTGSGSSSGSKVVKGGVAGMGMGYLLSLQLASFSEDDLVEVRLLVESLAARNPGASATEGDIAELRSLGAQMGAADTVSCSQLASAFCARIINAADNALARVLTGALLQAQLHTSGTASDRGADSQQMAREVSAIVDAIARGDGDCATELLPRTFRVERRPRGPSVLKWAG